MNELTIHIDSKDLNQSNLKTDDSLLHLINGCKNEVRLAQSGLYKKTFHFMFKIAMRYENNHDESLLIVNEAFYKILISIQKFDSNKSYYSWAKTILLNCIFNKFKAKNTLRSNVNHAISDSELALLNTPISPTILEKIDSDYVINILSTLPENTRHIFNLYVMEEFSHKEIAELLNITVNASKWHVYEGKRKLHQTLSLLNNKVQNGK